MNIKSTITVSNEEITIGIGVSFTQLMTFSLLDNTRNYTFKKVLIKLYANFLKKNIYKKVQSQKFYYELNLTTIEQRKIWGWKELIEIEQVKT